MSTPASLTRQTALALTEAQSGLWYAQRMDPGNPIFNTAHAIEIRGALNVAAFDRAVQMAGRETGALAWRMADAPEGPRQWVDEARRPQLEHIDLRGEANPAQAARAAMLLDLHTPIDPTRDPLAAQKLLQVGEQHY